MAVDGKADAPQRLFVGIVVAGGLICLSWAATRLTPLPSLLYLLAVAGLVTVATTCGARLRIRGDSHAVSCASAALLIALAVLPASWAVACVAVGALVTSFLKGETSTRKIAFNTAAHAIGVTAAYGAVVACGLAPGIGVIANSPAGWAHQLPPPSVPPIPYPIVHETLPPTPLF